MRDQIIKTLTKYIGGRNELLLLLLQTLMTVFSFVFFFFKTSPTDICNQSNINKKYIENNNINNTIQLL